ncbi:hypothetical protein GTV32_03570 [Gordonia sp. SID5947]|nr:hypothetical protein [Gordonia sp. SID5947]
MPRPEPDGSPDSRCTERRQADALEAILDIAARCSDTASAPTTQVPITVPGDRTTGASLQFGRSGTATTLRQLYCDASITTEVPTTSCAGPTAATPAWPTDAHRARPATPTPTTTAGTSSSASTDILPSAVRAVTTPEDLCSLTTPQCESRRSRGLPDGE